MDRRQMVKRSEEGFALVLVIVVTALLTAMVVEFSYGVYVSLSGLHNWRSAQRLSAVARSGITLAQKTIRDHPELLRQYGVTDVIEIPVERILQGFDGTTLITVVDESARFNLNSLRNSSGTLNAEAVAQLKELLRVLDMRTETANLIAKRLVKESGLPGPAEALPKDGYLDSPEELLLIRGVTREDFDRLSPYVTVYGTDISGRYSAGSGLVNINTAPVPVIMSLGIARDRAEQIVRDRTLNPYTDRTKGSLGIALMGRITVTSAVYRITSAADDDGLHREIVCVLNTGTREVMYWKEL